MERIDAGMVWAPPGAEGLFGHDAWHVVGVVKGGFHQDCGGLEEVRPGGFRLSAPGARHRMGYGSERSLIFHAVIPGAWAPAALRAVCERQTNLFHDGEDMPDPATLIGETSLDTELRIRGALASMAWQGATRPPWLPEARAELAAGHSRVSAVADRFQISAEHLSRVFRRAYGVTPAEYRQASRVRTAAALVSETDEPFAQIAYATGFAAQSHLNAAMRRWLKTSPGALRRAVPDQIS